MFRNFFLTGLVFILSGSIFYTTIQHLDPLGEQKWIALVVFCVSAFFGIASFGTFVFFFADEVLSHRNLGAEAFLIAFRRGSLVGLFLVVLLILQLMHLLSVFEILVLGIFLALVEFIFWSSKSS